jgi:hypothetical protein
MTFRSLRALALGLLVGGLAVSAQAEVTAWDQAAVSGLAKQLQTATRELYDTFYKQPKVGVGQQRDYYRLQQDVRRLRNETKELADALAGGAGQPETLPIYEELMQVVRRARVDASHVFTTQDVEQRASTTRQLLNQLSAYYDPDAAPLQAPAR